MATKLSTDVIDLSGNTEALTIPSGITASSINIDFLVVAGGGGGGRSTSTGSAGGGGAGGLLTSFGTSGGNQSALAALSLAVNTNHIVEIGTGGSGLSSGNGQGGDGTNSTLGTIISTGGGGGGYANQDGRPGGSGGGGGNGCSSGGAATGTTAHPIQGMQGGGAIHNPPNYPIGGGGGASTTQNCGSNGNDMPGGGAGLTVNTGVTNNAYAGGGASGWYNTSNRGGGSFNGIGGGGGYPYGGGTYVPVVANSGSGGGGSGTGTSGPGADGIVIIKYETANTITISAGLTYSSTTSGSDTIVTFTAGTGTISFAGTSVGRPSSPTEGLMRENTTTGKMEFYDGSLWQEINDTASTYSPIVIPAANFNTVIWTSTGGNTDISITGVGFKPDFVWAKSRTDAYSYTLYDSVRGAGTNHWLASDLTNTESSLAASAASYGYLGSFDDDGFTGNAGTSDNSYFNYNTNKDYVSWSWKAGGTAVTNSVGTNTNDSNVSANVAAGFSIVKVVADGTNNTIGHGLGGIPELIISKNIGVAGNWGVYSAPTGIGHYMYLNESTAVNATFDSSVYPSVSSTTFAPGSGGWNYTNGNTYIHYLWRSIPNYSKIGFYVGNGSTTGPEIYTGFKPAWLMTKPTTSGYWYILDNKRNTSNPRNTGLFPNDSLAEITNTNYNVDFNNTGFQLKNNTIGFNNLGVTYIYMVFAE